MTCALRIPYIMVTKTWAKTSDADWSHGILDQEMGEGGKERGRERERASHWHLAYIFL